MNSATIRTAIASMVLGIVSVSFCVPAILFSFFRWLPGMLIVLVSLAPMTIARARVLRPAGRAIAGLVLGIIGTSISGLLLLCLLLLCIAF